MKKCLKFRQNRRNKKAFRCLKGFLIEFESNYSSSFTAKVSNLTFMSLNNFCFFLA